jgi:hypothetical protein
MGKRGTKRTTQESTILYEQTREQLRITVHNEKAENHNENKPKYK